MTETFEEVVNELTSDDEEQSELDSDEYTFFMKKS